MDATWRALGRRTPDTERAGHRDARRPSAVRQTSKTTPGRPTPTWRSPPCRWLGRRRSARLSLRSRARRRRCWLEGRSRTIRFATPWSTRASTCSTGPCTRTRRCQRRPPRLTSFAPSEPLRFGSAMAAASRSRPDASPRPRRRRLGDRRLAEETARRIAAPPGANGGDSRRPRTDRRLRDAAAARPSRPRRGAQPGGGAAACGSGSRPCLSSCAGR